MHNPAAHKPGLAIHQSHQAAFALSATNRIALPIADARLLTNLFRPFRDRSIWMNGVVIGVAVYLPLSMAAKVRFGADARQQASMDMPIDRRTAQDAVRMFFVPAACDLFRRPVPLAEGCYNIHKFFRFKLLDQPARHPLSMNSLAVSSVGIVALLASIPLQFTADC